MSFLERLTVRIRGLGRYLHKRPPRLDNRADGGRRPRRLTACLIVAAVVVGFAPQRATANSFVLFDFNLNLSLSSRYRDTLFIELFDDRPLTRDNFLAYVNGGKYDDSLIHRLSRNFVLQGGGYFPRFLTPNALDPTARIDLDGNPATPNPTVNNEFSNLPMRSNLAGTLAMAKQGGNPNSATSEFFFNLANNGANLDNQNGGFTVFAQVAGDGMSVINAYNNGLSLANLNPDYDNNGSPDTTPGLPFYTSSTDAVPFLPPNILLVVEDAEQIDYFGAGSTLNVPAGGLTIATRDTFLDTGVTITGTGGITIGAGKTLGVRESIPLARAVVNQGTLAPGLRLASLTVQSYQQAATGTLDIQLGGVTADTQYDQLVVTGTAQLNGTLDVSLLGTFAPAPGNTFTLVSAANITGSFSSIQLPQLAAGQVWDIKKTSTAVTVSVVSADYNHDGVVNAADYTVWRNTRGNTVSLAYAGADGNGDLVINQADYLIWKANLGKTAGGTPGSGAGAAAAVPEPASAVLFLVALCWGIARRRR